MTTHAERNKGTFSSASSSAPLWAWAVLYGLVAGIAVSLLTAIVSGSDIGGATWSLRGNGALIILFGLAPALLAAGWVWLAERTVLQAVVAAVVTLVLELLIGFGPIIAGAGIGPSLGLALVVTPLAPALVAGAAIARSTSASSVVVCVAAIALSAGVPGLGYFLAPLLLPVVLATPVLARRWSASLGAHCLILAVAMLLGVFGAQYLSG